MDEDRLAEIQRLPEQLRDDALVDWKTITLLLSSRDIQHTRRTLLNEGLPTVELSPRKRLPRWGTLREFLRKRERADV
jgi:hypothetical protein